MPNRTMPNVTMKGVPILRVGDVQTAKQFYGEFLGFDLDWEHYYEAGAPVYMQMSRDGLVLHLSQNNRFKEATTVFVETTGLDQLLAELSRRNSPWEVPKISVTPWKTKQMEIPDPFGNVLRSNEPQG
ncbi:MAG: VOC family protein [Deltaproteobacteria bacterium]|nr:VOC family protein [Deltaproteobacteria bacterium]